MEPIIKLKDIADELNVSIVTVSNALAGRKGVSEKTRNRIIEKAEELGYINPIDENENKKSEKIGILVSDRYIYENASFYWAMYEKVVLRLSKKGHISLFEIIDELNPRVEDLRLLELQLSGLIIIGKIESEFLTKLIDETNFPITLLDFNNKGYECDSILSNNYVGMYKMTKLLVKNGHRGIAFVGSIDATENIMDRYYGYRKCMAECGLKVFDEWVLNDRNIYKNEMKVELPKHMPTAFVCSSDLSASVLYDELIKVGYRVPEDISIVGYDNYLYGHSLFDNITTYDVRMDKMAKIAVDILIKKIKLGNDDYDVRYVDGKIIERNSVKNINYKK